MHYAASFYIVVYKVGFPFDNILLDTQDIIASLIIFTLNGINTLYFSSSIL